MSKTIVRDVRDLVARDRDVLEHALGERLSENQRLVVQILTLAEVEPEAPPSATGAALPDWCDVFRGLSEEEIAEVEAVARQRLDLTRPPA